MSSYTTPNIDHNLYRTIVPTDYTQQMIQAVQYKQNLYDTGLSNVKNKIASMNQLESQVTSEPIRNMIRDYNKEVQGKMSSLSQADFSISSNVDSMTSMYDNLLNDQSFISDYAATKHIKNEYQRAIAMRDSDKKDVYSQFSTTNLQRVMMDLDDLKSANSIDDIKRASSKAMGATYTPYTDVSANIISRIKESGLNVTYDRAQGGYIVTTTSGKVAYNSFNNFIMATLNEKDKAQLRINSDVQFYTNSKSDPGFTAEVLDSSIKDNVNLLESFNQEISSTEKKLEKLSEKHPSILTDEDRAEMQFLTSTLEQLQSKSAVISDNINDLNTLDRSNPNRVYDVANRLYHNSYMGNYVSKIAAGYKDPSVELQTLKKDETYFAKIQATLDNYKAQTGRMNAETSRLEHKRNLVKDQFDMGLLTPNPNSSIAGEPANDDQGKTKIDNGLESVNTLFTRSKVESHAYPKIANLLIKSMGSGFTEADQNQVYQAILSNDISKIKNEKLKERILEQIDSRDNINTIQDYADEILKNPNDSGIKVNDSELESLRTSIAYIEKSTSQRLNSIAAAANAEFAKRISENNNISPQRKAEILSEKQFTVKNGQLVNTRDNVYLYTSNTRPSIGASEIGSAPRVHSLSSGDFDDLIENVAESSPELFVISSTKKESSYSEFVQAYTAEGKQLTDDYITDTHDFMTAVTKKYVNEGDFLQNLPGGQGWEGDDKDVVAEIAQTIINSSQMNTVGKREVRLQDPSNIEFYKTNVASGFRITDVGQEHAKKAIAVSQGKEKWEDVDEGIKKVYNTHFSTPNNFFQIPTSTSNTYLQEDYMADDLRNGSVDLEYYPGTSANGYKDKKMISASLVAPDYGEQSSLIQITVPYSPDNKQYISHGSPIKSHRIELDEATGVYSMILDHQKISKEREHVYHIPARLYNPNAVMGIPGLTNEFVKDLTTKTGQRILKSLYDDKNTNKYSGQEVYKLLNAES